jgi:hypothetical protein
MVHYLILFIFFTHTSLNKCYIAKRLGNTTSKGNSIQWGKEPGDKSQGSKHTSWISSPVAYFPPQPFCCIRFSIAKKLGKASTFQNSNKRKSDRGKSTINNSKQVW